MLSPEAVDRAAALLVQARRDVAMLDAIPSEIRPTTLSEAYAVQRRFIELLGRPVGGWFGACTNAAIQGLLGLEEPYYARLLADRIFDSPARLDPADYPPMVFECELAFELGRDFTPAGAPYDRAEIEDAITRVRPAIEVVAGHLKDWPNQDVFSVIADNGTDGALVVGEGVTEWRGLDLVGLDVVLRIDGAEVRRGRGERVLGDPLAAFLWLVDAVTRDGGTLRAGEPHNTGTATEIYWARPGDHAVADFGALGGVEVRLA